MHGEAPADDEQSRCSGDFSSCARNAGRLRHARVRPGRRRRLRLPRRIGRPSAPPCAPRSTPARSTGASSPSTSRFTSAATASPTRRPATSGSTADCSAAGRFAWATVMDEYAHQVDFSGARRARAARCSSSSSERAPGATRSAGLVARRQRLRAVLLHGRVGLLALEGQLLPPRLGHGRVRIDAGGRVPHAALGRSSACRRRSSRR